MKHIALIFAPLMLVSCVAERLVTPEGGGGGDKPSDGDKTISITIPGGFSVASTRLDPNAEAAIEDLWLLTFAADAGDGTTGALEAVQQIASADLYPTDTPNEYEFRITPESGDHRFVLVSNVENLGQPDGIAIGDNIWAPSNLDTYQTFAAAETDYGRMYQFGSATMPAASMVAWPGNVNPADISASNPGIRWSDGEDVAAFNYPAAWSSSGGWITANNPCPPGLDDPNSGAVAEPGRQHDKRRRE